MNRTINKNNFKLFNFENREFVFLTGPQQIMELTTQELKTYFNNALGLSTKKGLKVNYIKEITESLEEIISSAEIPIESSTAPKQAMLTLNITHECNMACKYCFASTTNKHKNVMPSYVARKAIQNLLHQFPNAETYMIYFFGGEPLLYKAFIKDAVNIAKQEICENANKRVSFLINTNGTLLSNPCLLDFLSKENFTVTISIDGPENENDRSRVFNNGRGSFSRIMEGINIMKNRNINFNLRATLSPRTRHLAKIFKFFEDMKIPYSYAFTITASTKEKYETQFSESDMFRFDKELDSVMNYFLVKKINHQQIYAMDFNRKLDLVKNGSLITHGCEAGRNSLLVDESGNYFSCQNMLPFKETSIGNIDIGFDDDRRRCYRSHHLDSLPVCKLCWARYLCGGGCETERYVCSKELIAGFPQRCKMTQMEWKHIISTYIKWNLYTNNNINN